MDRRDFLRLTALGLAAPAVAPLLAACTRNEQPRTATSPSAPGGSAGGPGTAIGDIARDAAPDLQVIEATGEVVITDSRLSFGLLEPDNTPVTDAQVTVYVGRSPDDAPLADAPATWLQGEVAQRGIYVTELPLRTAGRYVVLVVATTAEGARLRGGTQLSVLAKSKSPVRGQRAIAVATPTAGRPQGADPLCSRKPVCSGHALSLDAALRNGKPTVVAFSAPAFCATELCGPVVDIVDAAVRPHAGRLNYVHAEAYRKRGKELAPALRAWNFTSEPWTYFVDAKGIVTDRLAGAIGDQEVAARLASLGVR